MSTQIICDCCGKSGKGANKFEYLCHINDIVNKNNIGYVDGEGNAVSDRTITLDLCNKCYNRIVTSAIELYNTIRAKNV